jgi:hypothetical protein
MTVLLGRAIWFPDPGLAGPDEPVAVGGDLSVPRLLAAYRSGIFPWTVEPITWWSPDPRAIFELDCFHVPRSLARTLKRRPYEITFDRAFREVMEGLCCARGMVLAGSEVGDGAGDFEDAVVGAGAEVQVGHRHLEQILRLPRPAQCCLSSLRAHAGVAGDRGWPLKRSC